MKFIGLFCVTTATNNEEYKKVLKRKNLWMIALGLAGIVIAAAAYFARGDEGVQLPEYILGVYCGLGTGLTLAAIILFVRNCLLMGDEEKLRQSRLKNSDERIAEIRGKAALVATSVTLFLGTGLGLLLGIYEQVLIKAVLFMLYIFLFSYIIACAYYQKKI